MVSLREVYLWERTSVLGTGQVGEGKLQTGLEIGPIDLSGVDLVDRMEIGKVFVVSPDNDWG